jgi:hypothetical protein
MVISKESHNPQTPISAEAENQKPFIVGDIEINGHKLKIGTSDTTTGVFTQFTLFDPETLTQIAPIEDMSLKLIPIFDKGEVGNQYPQYKKNKNKAILWSSKDKEIIATQIVIAIDTKITDLFNNNRERSIPWGWELTISEKTKGTLLVKLGIADNKIIVGEPKTRKLAVTAEVSDQNSEYHKSLISK